MNTLRRYSALFAALVLTYVSVQTLDLGLCCGAPAPVPPVAKTEQAVGMTGAGDMLGSAALAPSSSGERSVPGQMAQPDCLYHLVFTSTSLGSALLVAAAPPSRLAEVPEPLRSALLPPSGHVPIA